MLDRLAAERWTDMRRNCGPAWRGIRSSLPAGTRLLEYRIEKVLGHGGFGITYLARDTHLDKTVAIKEYLPVELAFRNGANVSVRSASERVAFTWGLRQFMNEARTLARFSHPNLMPVHRFFEANATAYFVMDYIKGQTFAARLTHQPVVSEDQLRAVMMPVMQGLEAVHRASVLHRDIKPENILLRRDGSPVLIDFGAARLNLNSMTRSAMAQLTAGYAPLEQYGLSGHQGPWTDIYALGAMAYRAISGRKPPEAVNRVHDDPMVPACVVGYGRYSPALLGAVDWALAVNPEDRPKAIGEWLPALERRHAPVIADLIAEDVIAADSTAEAARATNADAAPAALASHTSPRPWSKLGSAVSSLLALGLAVMPLAALRGRQAVAPAPAVVAGPAQAIAVTVATPPPAEVANVPPAPTAAPAKTSVRMATPASRVSQVRRSGSIPVSAREALSTFRDCAQCPVMVVLPAGAFQMGSAGGAESRKWEGPIHRVTLAKSFAMGRYEVTAGQWQTCVDAGACLQRAGARAGANLPAVNVSQDEARAYTAWLSRLTHRHYRLPSEAEWEYAARANTTTERFWGHDASHQCAYANGAVLNAAHGARAASCSDRYAGLALVGSLRPNWFDLYDTTGNVWEWTQDCWKDSYAGAPGDGRAVDAPRCAARVIRGGSWRTGAESLRSTSRSPGQRGDNVGFRVLAE